MEIQCIFISAKCNIIHFNPPTHNLYHSSTVRIYTVLQIVGKKYEEKEVEEEADVREMFGGKKMTMMKVPVFCLTSSIMRKLMCGIRCWQQSTWCKRGLPSSWLDWAHSKMPLKTSPWQPLATPSHELLPPPNWAPTKPIQPSVFQELPSPNPQVGSTEPSCTPCKYSCKNYYKHV